MRGVARVGLCEHRAPDDERAWLEIEAGGCQGGVGGGGWWGRVCGGGGGGGGLRAVVCDIAIGPFSYNVL